jgi:hypothetical protein
MISGSSVSRIARGIAAACAVAVVLAAPAPSPAQVAQSQVTVPEDTGAGVWPGTYVYACRDFKIAFWVRERNGLPEFKARYLSVQTPESFETDWNGDASYFFSGQPGRFEMHFAKRNARRIEGTWHWTLESGERSRREEGTFAVFRSGYGRALVVHFDKLEREIRSGEKIRNYPLAPLVWTFWKVSKRSDVLWEELPF